MLILHGLTPLHWAVAGAAIGVIVVLTQAWFNRSLGVSTGFECLCGLWSRRPYFRRSAIRGRGRWRLPFFVGLLFGGVLSAWLGGGWAPTWDLGARFEAGVGLGPVGKSLWMLVGGFLVGFGTRMAGGCTSGHGIFGNARLERASLVTTVAFMAAGMVTTHLVYRVIFAA